MTTSPKNEVTISVGHHVEAIDEFGNWCKAEIINIIEDNLILKFLDRIESYHLIIDISTNKWHHVVSPNIDTFSFRSNMFEKGDLVMSKRQDNKYHLSQILDITTKFETIEKEYHILYLYDNVHDIVSQSRLKCPNSSHATFHDLDNEYENNEIIKMNRITNTPYKQCLESVDDNFFYNRNMKAFTDNCKLQRVKFAHKNIDSSDFILSNNVDKHFPNEKLSKENEIIHSSFQTDETTESKVRHSQRIKRNSVKNSDYFYTDCLDHMLKEKSNDSQVSTPITFEASDELSNNSPTSAPMTTLYSSYLKQKAEYFLNILSDKVSVNDQKSNKLNEYDNNDNCQSAIVRQDTEQIDQKDPKLVYTTNSRYYSGVLKTNRKYMKRKKKYNKSKIKSFINNHKSRNKYNNDESDYPKYQPSSKDHLQLFPKAKINSSNSHRSFRRTIYCNRCKKSTYNKDMIQCAICLCWSHRVCYDISEQREDGDFWECDGCANIDEETDCTKSEIWFRDKFRFHDIPRNELPWSSNCGLPTSEACSIRSIVEMQSFLSLSQRVLDAIRQRMDQLIFKEATDISDQDDHDILKNICAYDNNDANLTSLITDDIVTQNLSQDNLSFLEYTPTKNGCDRNKALNSSCDGILDCEIQKLDIIPKADFDALINDLNLNTDICKDGNGDRQSKSSILDLIDYSYDINGNRVFHDAVIPFTQSSLHYHNLEVDGSDSVIDITNDEISSLLLDKYSQRSQTVCEDFYLQDNERSKFLFPQSYLDNNGNRDTSKSTSYLRSVINRQSLSNIHESRPPTTPFIDHRIDESLMGDCDRYLSPSDRRSLDYLMAKYDNIESIVDCVEKTLSATDIDDNNLGQIIDDGQYHQVNRYLHWLLYTGRRHRDTHTHG